MGLPRKFNVEKMWRSMEGTGKFVAATFIMKSGSSYWSSYTTMAGVLANFGPNSQTILPVWHTFPTRCSRDGFFHFSICCSNCLGWY